MAPRTINDDPVLFQIALCFLDEPDASFASIERKAILHVEAHKHSDDSRRKRLQRKFTADRARWMHEANAYRAKRREQQQAEQILAFQEMLVETGRSVAQVMNNIRDRIGPGLALVAEQLSRPEVQEGLRNVARAVEQMQRRAVITIPK